MLSHKNYFQGTTSTTIRNETRKILLLVAVTINEPRESCNNFGISCNCDSLMEFSSNLIISKAKTALDEFFKRIFPKFGTTR